MKYYLSAILGMLMWSSSFIATKIAYRSFSPLLLCFIRFLIASSLMIILRFFQKPKIRILKKDRKNVILSAVAGISVYYAFENIALKYTSASAASLIEAAYPAITILIGVLIYHERSSKRMLAGIVISIIGVIIITDFSDMASNGMLGNLLLILDGFLWGFYNFLVQGISDEYDTFTLSYYQFLYGTLFFIPMLFFEHPVMVHLNASVITAVIYLSAGCSVLAFILYNYGLKGISASSASAIMNLMPVFGIILSVLILHETITLRQILGGIIIMSGVLISTSRTDSRS